MFPLAITFDLWETLIADSAERDLKRTQARVEQIAGAHSQVWVECSRFWQRSQDVPFEHQIKIFLDLISPGLGCSLPRRIFTEISQCYAQAVLQYPPALIEGANETLGWLRSRGYRLGLICNTGRSPGWILRRLLSEFRTLAFFDSALFSDETIVRKPDPAIFHRALQEIGAAAEVSVHVGDSWENDVQGALTAGMLAIWIGSDARKATVPCVSSVADLPRVLN